MAESFSRSLFLVKIAKLPSAVLEAICRIAACFRISAALTMVFQESLSRGDINLESLMSQSKIHDDLFLLGGLDILLSISLGPSCPPSDFLLSMIVKTQLIRYQTNLHKT